MRLYLSIERNNNLAPVKIVWSLATQRPTCSIAELLQDVNETFPLRPAPYAQLSYTSLYVVTLKGYECLRHHEVTSICKDGDELNIRPLTNLEIVERHNSHRWVLDQDGSFLVDGAPTSECPDSPSLISMPPNKRRKLDGVERQHELLDDNEEQDNGDLVDEEAHGEQVQRAKSSLARTSQIKETDHRASDSASSSDLSSGSSSGMSSDLEEDSEDDSSDSSVERPLVNGAETHATSTGLHAPTVARSHTGHAEIDHTSASDPTNTNGIPFQGLQRTHLRNIRRREKKRLEYLKAQGILGPQATFADLHQHDQAELGAQQPNTQAVTNESNSNPKQPSEADFMACKQRLLKAIASGGVDVNENFDAVSDNDEDGPPEQLSSRSANRDELIERPEATLPDSGGTAVSTTIAMMVPPSVERRKARLDVGGSARLLFGSLGLRAPKTDADKVKIRENLAARGQHTAAVNSKPVASVQADPVLTAAEYEDWQSKIDLSAVECLDEGIILSAPPFPFKQRWDVQYHKPNKRKRNTQQAAQHIESYDKYNASGNDALNYDDADVEGDFDEEHWEEGALLDENDDSYAEEGEQEDPFPPLPDEIGSLPLLEESAAAVGDYVVHTELVCSAATQWQPRWIARTIQLVEQTARGWEVKLAMRDLPQRRYDEDGNRVYDKFEMQGSDDEAETDDAREVIWNELTAPRLLLRA